MIDYSTGSDLYSNPRFVFFNDFLFECFVLLFLYDYTVITVYVSKKRSINNEKFFGAKNLTSTQRTIILKYFKA